MAVAIKVTVDDRKVRKLLRTAMKKTGDLTRPMSELGLWMVRDAGRRLHRREGDNDARSGALRASLTFEPARDQVAIESNLAYAAVQQLGHPGIRPKPPNKYLAMPLLPHLRRQGIWPRDLPEDELHFGGFSRAGNPLLRGSDGTPMYVLLKEVVIDVEPYLVFGPEAQEFLRRRLIKHIGLDQD